MQCSHHEDSDIIFCPVRRFVWYSFSTPLYHKLYVALIFFTHVTFTCIESTFSYPHKKFLIARPPRTRTHNSAGFRIRPANEGTRNPHGLTRPAQDSRGSHRRIQIF